MLYTVLISGGLNNKQLFKQSALVKEYTKETSKINTAQSVLIYKLTEDTLKYVAKQKEASENE